MQTQIKKAINQNAILATLNVSQWTGSKKDNRITREVQTNHNADKTSGRFVKNLIDKSDLNPIAKVGRQIRTLFYEKTLAWGENGERILSTKVYFDFMSKYAELKSEFDHLVEKFLDGYDQAKEAAKVRLGTMYNESDYPTRLEIERKFGVSIKLMPFPESQVNVNLDSNELDKLNQEIVNEIDSRSLSARLEVRDRVREVLSHLRAKMLQEDPKIYQTNFTNVTDLAKLMPELNVWDDPKIDQLSREILEAMEYNADDAKASVDVRSKVADKSKEILNKLDSFF